MRRPETLFRVPLLLEPPLDVGGAAAAEAVRAAVLQTGFAAPEAYFVGILPGPRVALWFAEDASPESAAKGGCRVDGRTLPRTHPTHTLPQLPRGAARLRGAEDACCEG